MLGRNWDIMGYDGFAQSTLGLSHQSRHQCSVQRHGLTQHCVAVGKAGTASACRDADWSVTCTVAASGEAGFTVIIKFAQESLGIKSVCTVTPTSTQLRPRGWD